MCCLVTMAVYAEISFIIFKVYTYSHTGIDGSGCTSKIQPVFLVCDCGLSGERGCCLAAMVVYTELALLINLVYAVAVIGVMLILHMLKLFSFNQFSVCSGSQ